MLLCVHVSGRLCGCAVVCWVAVCCVISMLKQFSNYGVEASPHIKSIISLERVCFQSAGEKQN